MFNTFNFSLMESQVTRFARNNDCPTDPQCATLERIQEVLKAEATKLGRSRPQDDDEQKRKEVTNLLGGCTAALAPIRRLSSDILLMIFHFAMPYQGWLQRDHKPDLTQAPLSLTHVCSYWRRIALGTPGLWTSLSIMVKNGALTSNYGAKWLSRAGDHLPLSLHIQCLRGQWLGFDLKRIAPRLKVLQLHITPSHKICRTLLSEPQFDLLEELRIEFCGREPQYDDTEDDDDMPPPDVLENLMHAPRLSSLHLELDFPFARPLSRTRPLFPWAQLTELDISEIHEMAWPATISLCTNLREATLRLGGSVGMYWVEPLHYTPLPHLMSLTLVVSDDFDPSLFQKLHFPNLNFLMIEQPDEITNVWYPRAWPDPEQFYKSLENLKTLYFYHPTERLPDILRHTPNLEHLDVHTNCRIDNVLEVLTLSFDSPDRLKDNILPKLTKLELGHPASRLGLDASEDKLAAMIASRLSKTKPQEFASLKEISIGPDSTQTNLIDKVETVVDGNESVEIHWWLGRSRGDFESEGETDGRSDWTTDDDSD